MGLKYSLASVCMYLAPGSGMSRVKLESWFFSRSNERIFFKSLKLNSKKRATKLESCSVCVFLEFYSRHLRTGQDHWPLPPLLYFLLAPRFYSTGALHHLIGDSGCFSVASRLGCLRSYLPPVFTCNTVCAFSTFSQNCGDIHLILNF